MKFKKHVKVLIYIVLFIIFCVCITYLHSEQIYRYKFQPGIFRLSVIDHELYGLYDGDIYKYGEEGRWEDIRYGEKISSIFSGELACFLEQDGGIYCEEYEQNPEHHLPLSAGAAKEFCEKALEINQTQPFRVISGHANSLFFCAVLLDGSILYPTHNCEYGTYVMEERSITINGGTILTEEGNVYRLIRLDNNKDGIMELEKDAIYTGGDCVKIEKMRGYPIGVGFTNTGDLFTWNDSTKEFPDLSSWEDVREIELAQAFIAGLTKSGTILFEHLWDDELTEEVQAVVGEWENIIDIEHYYNEWLYAVDDKGKCYCVEIK